MILTKASSQWANRPADQRFWTVAELLAATKAHHDAARTAKLDFKTLNVAAKDGEVILTGENGGQTELTHWAFGQLCTRIGAPAGYLRTLTPDLAVQNINEGIGKNTLEPAVALLHENGGYFARAITSEKYTRIWNDDIVKHLAGFEADGWHVPPAYPTTGENTRIATAEDATLSLTIKEGDTIGPAGLYASFEDMFAFMIHPERQVKDGSDEGLMRGFYVWNSEVGKSTFGISTFLFRGVCGNHQIFSAKDVTEITLRHVGKADERAFAGLEARIKAYADESVSDIENAIVTAQNFVLKGRSMEETVDFIFGQRLLTKSLAKAAYNAVVPEEDGDPFTAYGFAQGLTRLSQMFKNTDERVTLDRIAGKVIEIAL